MGENDPAEFSVADAMRIANAVRRIEAEARTKPVPQFESYQTAGNVALVLLTEDLKHNQKAKGKFRYPADSYDPDNYQWETDQREILVYPWKMDVGTPNKKIPATWEVWCVYLGGRWYPLVPQDCMEDDV